MSFPTFPPLTNSRSVGIPDSRPMQGQMAKRKLDRLSDRVGWHSSNYRKGWRRWTIGGTPGASDRWLKLVVHRSRKGSLSQRVGKHALMRINAGPKVAPSSFKPLVPQSLANTWTNSSFNKSLDVVLWQKGKRK